MKKKIFAGLCAFSMAIGAKGGSEKVAAAPIDKVRYGTQALLFAFQTFTSFMFGPIRCMKDKVSYWNNGNGSSYEDYTRLQKIGFHAGLVYGLEGLYLSLKNYSKTEPKSEKG